MATREDILKAFKLGTKLPESPNPFRKYRAYVHDIELDGDTHFQFVLQNVDTGALFKPRNLRFPFTVGTDGVATTRDGSYWGVFAKHSAALGIPGGTDMGDEFIGLDASFEGKYQLPNGRVRPIEEWDKEWERVQGIRAQNPDADPQVQPQGSQRDFIVEWHGYNNDIRRMQGLAARTGDAVSVEGPIESRVTVPGPNVPHPTTASGQMTKQEAIDLLVDRGSYSAYAVEIKRRGSTYSNAAEFFPKPVVDGWVREGVVAEVDGKYVTGINYDGPKNIPF